MSKQDAAADAAVRKMGFAPLEIRWVGGRSFEASFSDGTEAERLATEVTSRGGSAASFPACFGGPAFVALTLRVSL